jgi:hypothetical protein
MIIQIKIQNITYNIESTKVQDLLNAYDSLNNAQKGVDSYDTYKDIVLETRYSKDELKIKFKTCNGQTYTDSTVIARLQIVWDAWTFWYPNESFIWSKVEEKDFKEILSYINSKYTNNNTKSKSVSTFIFLYRLFGISLPEDNPLVIMSQSISTGIKQAYVKKESCKKNIDRIEMFDAERESIEERLFKPFDNQGTMDYSLGSIYELQLALVYKLYSTVDIPIVRNEWFNMMMGDTGDKTNWVDTEGYIHMNVFKNVSEHTKPFVWYIKDWDDSTHELLLTFIDRRLKQDNGRELFIGKKGNPVKGSTSVRIFSDMAGFKIGCNDFRKLFVTENTESRDRSVSWWKEADKIMCHSRETADTIYNVAQEKANILLKE